MIDFPASPTLGQVFTSGAQNWTWDGAKWVASGVYVGPPQFSNTNRIINGDMRIDQRNNGASITPATGAYTADRWKFQGAQASKFTAQRVASGAGMISQGWPYQLGMASTSAYTPGAAEYFAISQFIEADMIGDFAWGTSNAQPVTLSFMASSSLPGTFGGSIRNDTNTRSYPFSFQLVASTWTKIVITIPGDTAGTWVLSGNALGVYVAFDLGSGSSYRGPANVWAATTSPGYQGVTGAVSVVATSGANFFITGVKLETGSIATPFNRKSPQESLADCQRYYQQLTQCLIAVNGNGAGVVGSSIPYPVVMRAAPTVGLGSPVYYNASTLATNAIYSDVIRLQCTVTANGYAYAIANPLTLSAEL